MDPVARHHRATYDGVAGQYAERNAERHPVIARYLDTFREKADGGCLLDVGCGPGRDLTSLREAGHQACGLDLSLRMAELARRAGGPTVCADMASLPIRNAAAGGVWCLAGFLHVPKRALAELVVDELRRVCRSGGSLVVSVRSGSFEGWRPTRYAPEAERYFSDYRPDELSALLKAGSFDVVESTEFSLRDTDWVIARGVAA